MPISFLQQFCVLSSISIIIILTNHGHAYSQCLDDQKNLLLHLKNELIFNSSFPTKLVHWNRTDDCCKWEGVGCDASGHVTSLSLDYKGISGGIENSSSLVSLEYLEKLNLAHNSLEDTIPSLNLSKLVELDLSSNQLKGPISDSFFVNLESLELLSLSHNLFDGTLELENTQTIMNSNWSRFHKLKKLSLSSCNLQKFPDFVKRSNLNFLDLSDNQIRGEIPSWIWEIGINNGGLYHLNLSYNLLDDIQRPYSIPMFLAELDFRSNQLHGELPLLPRGASYVDFSNNQFDRPVPLDLISFNFNLIFLSIANNSISGWIPTCICSGESIQALDLSMNSLSGSIPPCIVERMPSLQMLNLRMNNISGEIPDRFPANCGMRILDLSSNNLGGNLPKSLQNCTSLWFVNVGMNMIGGSFPCMLPSRLKFLVLHGNKFDGEVKCGESWSKLQTMDISSNSFSGGLHTVSFSSWKKMALDSSSDANERIKGLAFSPDFFTQVTLTTQGLKLKFDGILRNYVHLDLSSNNFQGEIPEEIGNLTALRVLNLSRNSFQGRIPRSLGGMATLEALDLSENQLTERIPVELAGLTFLSFLNLSHNKLVGMIPRINQFATFVNDSYQGNAGLCGSPLSISCTSFDVSLKLGNMQPRGKSGMEGYYVSLFCLGAIYVLCMQE